MADEDDTGEGTSITMKAGDVGITIEIYAAWTPEMMDHMMTRMRRHIVAASRQLGITTDDEAADANT